MRRSGPRFVMSWSITINDLQANWSEVWTQAIIVNFLSQHAEHAIDLKVAVEAARAMGLASATLSGGRTPTPGTDDEVVVLTITGLGNATDFYSAMRRIIASGPDADALAHQAEAIDVTDEARLP